MNPKNTAKTAATTETVEKDATVPGQVTEDKAGSNGKATTKVSPDTDDPQTGDQVEDEKNDASDGKTSLVEKAKGLFKTHRSKFVIGAVATVVIGLLASRVHLAPVEDETEDDENTEV